MASNLLRRAGVRAFEALGLRVERVRRTGAGPLSMNGASVFGEFVADDGRRFALYDGYRDRMKRTWRLDHWATIALQVARRVTTLNPATQDLVRRLDRARTLPAPLDEFAAHARGLADEQPSFLARGDVPGVGNDVVAARATDEQIDSIATYYGRLARMTVAEYRRAASDPVEAGDLTALEVGCGAGYGVMALAGLGIRRSLGIEIAPAHIRLLDEAPRVLERFATRSPEVAARVRIFKGDMCELPLEDASVDFICSHAVIEHVFDPGSAFAEMARVLKPGGIVVHHFEPYYAPRGGHAACTLDFPWGHARLTPEEFRRYLREWRPHEVEHAARQYEELFPQPRVTLHDLEVAIAGSGLTLLSWSERWLDDHLPPTNVWRECARWQPALALRDLAAEHITMVATRGEAA